MKTLIRLFMILLLTGSQPLLAQTTQDTTRTASPKSSAAPLAHSSADDDDFNTFLLVFACIALAVMFGSMIVGFVATCLIGGFLFILVSTGILSAAILVGAYKRSIAAGFKTLLLIICSIGGILLGIGGLYLVNILFDLHLHHTIIAWSGLAGGLVGGILLSLVIIHVIRFCLARLSRTAP